MLKTQLSKMAVPVLALPRPAKRLVVLVVDLCLCMVTVWLAYFLRLGEFISITGPTMWANGALWASIVSVVLALSIFTVSGLYRAIFRYSNWPALLTVMQAVGIYGIVFATIFTIIGVSGVPRTLGIIQPMLLLLFVGGSRVFARVWLGDRYQNILKRASRPKVLIYGTGNSGRQLVDAMTHSHEMQVVGFLDDDDRLHGHVLNGLRIYAVADLAGLVHAQGIAQVILALPTVSRTQRNTILKNLAPFKVAISTLPSLNDFVQGRVSVSDLQELDIDDLLGRESVKPNGLLLNHNTYGKTVVVTGAGGSIGSELCRQIVRTQPKQLLLVDHSEFALYQIHQELLATLAGERFSHDLAHEETLDQASATQQDEESSSSALEIVPLLASVCDEVRMHQIMDTWKPHTVYHAAAYKHVPMVEHNPAEGLRNNVWGTRVCAEAAARSGVRNFVLISTDKAVRPTNIMGATKRLAEMVLQALAQAARSPLSPELHLSPTVKGHHGISAGTAYQPLGKAKQTTVFSIVRFGNVLGSSGSVVPLFREQIKNGGPITLTHTDITRYFMTIPEAAQLVIQAGAMGQGGDVFVLDMGEPVRIIDLARRMVQLSGLTIRDEADPSGDIALAVTGLRPGEKLFEELLIGDNPQTTKHPRIMKANEQFLSLPQLDEKLSALSIAMSVNDVPIIRSILQQIVSGYHPSGEVVDWVHLAQERKALAND